MKAFIACMISICIMTYLNLPEHMASLTLPLHAICLKHTPESAYSFIYEGIVCGENLPHQDLANLFKQSGLIHLIVVSGSHLVFLEGTLDFLLRKVKYRKNIINLVLVLYILMTLAQPPSVRAGLQRLLSALNKKLQWHWPDLLCCFMTGFFTLLLFPGWWNSHSFLLSWAATFAMTISRTKIHPRHLRFHFWMYWLLVIPLLTLTCPQPLSIFCNWLLAPLIGGILFPLSALCYFIPILHSFVDLGWQMLERLLEFLVQEAPRLTSDPTISLQVSLLGAWGYLIAIQLASYTWQVIWNRHHRFASTRSPQ